MKRVYRVRPGFWSKIIFPAILLIQIPVLMDRYRQYSEAPGTGTKIELLISAVIISFWTWYVWRRLRTVQVITVNDEVISFQKVRGDRSWPVETMTDITEDQIEFHLYSETKHVSVSKKTIDPELEKFLTERVNDRL